MIKTAFPEGAIGITSSIPIEIPLAAGEKIIDLNNIFVNADDPMRYIKIAQNHGYPSTCCSWIKGLYGLIVEEKIKRAIFVTGGDCSNTHAMLETLQDRLSDVFTFSFPPSRDWVKLSEEISRFESSFSVTPDRTESCRIRLSEIRTMLGKLDEMTWKTGQVEGSENFLHLVSSSDFGGDPDRFATNLRDFLGEAAKRPAQQSGLRIGVLGVPPVFSDFFQLISRLGARVVFNEIPRQFAMTEPAEDLTGQYLAYTYPWGVHPRIEDICRQAELRQLDALVHYTQAFCHRQIHDIVLRKKLTIPVLTLEGETPGPLDARTRLRIESFLEIVREKIQA